MKLINVFSFGPFFVRQRHRYGLWFLIAFQVNLIEILFWDLVHRQFLPAINREKVYTDWQGFWCALWIANMEFAFAALGLK